MYYMYKTSKYGVTSNVWHQHGFNSVRITSFFIIEQYIFLVFGSYSKCFKNIPHFLTISHSKFYSQQIWEIQRTFLRKQIWGIHFTQQIFSKERLYFRRRLLYNLIFFNLVKNQQKARQFYIFCKSPKK